MYSSNAPALQPQTSRPMSETPKVFVVDDDISMRESLESLIRYAGWQTETFATAEDFLDHPRELVPSCLVLDYRLPRLDGLGLQKQLAGAQGHLPIIFITYFGDSPMAVQAMKAGAIEILSKPFRDDELLSAIHQGIARSQSALLREAELRRVQELFATLSRREKEIMALVVAGRLNKQIALELTISEITVKAHRGRVMQKMKAKSLAELVSLAIRLNLESMPVP